MGQPRKLYKYDGVELDIHEWAARLGYNPDSLRKRIETLPPKEAFRPKAQRGLYAFGGKALRLDQWAAQLGWSRDFMLTRIKTMSAEEAFKPKPAKTTYNGCGHPFTTENSVWACNKRYCKICREAPKRWALQNANGKWKCGHALTPENTHTVLTSSGQLRYTTCLECFNNRNTKIGRPKFSHCKNGHEFTPENTRIVISHGCEIRTCKICTKEAKRRLDEKKAPARMDARKRRAAFCLKGLHPRTPENTTIDGVCRPCRDAYHKRTQQLRKQGLYDSMRAPRGATREQWLAFYSEKDSDGCMLWKASAYTAARMRAWLQLGNQRPPRTHVLEATCGKQCIAPQCLRVVPRKEAASLRAGFVKATEIKQLRYGKDREKYLQRSYQYVPKLRVFLKRLAHDRMSAHIEDIIQDCLLTVYLAWARDRKPIANIWSYLRTSAHRRLIDLRRLHEHRRTNLLSDIAFAMTAKHSDDGTDEEAEPDFPADELYDPAVYLEHNERLARAQRLWAYAARGLAPRTRKVVRLRMEGHTQKEIAKVLGIKENTVEVQLQNGYRSIRENWKRGSIDERLLLAG